MTMEQQHSLQKSLKEGKANKFLALEKAPDRNWYELVAGLPTAAPVNIFYGKHSSGPWYLGLCQELEEMLSKHKYWKRYLIFSGSFTGHIYDSLVFVINFILIPFSWTEIRHMHHQVMPNQLQEQYCHLKAHRYGLVNLFIIVFEYF